MLVDAAFKSSNPGDLRLFRFLRERQTNKPAIAVYSGLRILDGG